MKQIAENHLTSNSREKTEDFLGRGGGWGVDSLNPLWKASHAVGLRSVCEGGSLVPLERRRPSAELGGRNNIGVDKAHEQPGRRLTAEYAGGTDRASVDCDACTAAGMVVDEDGPDAVRLFYFIYFKNICFNIFLKLNISLTGGICC